MLWEGVRVQYFVCMGRGAWRIGMPAAGQSCCFSPSHEAIGSSNLFFPLLSLPSPFPYFYKYQVVAVMFDEVQNWAWSHQLCTISAVVLNILSGAMNPRRASWLGHGVMDIFQANAQEATIPVYKQCLTCSTSTYM